VITPASGVEPCPPLLLHAFASFAIGGAQMRFARLANRFGRAFRHIVVSLDGDIACSARLDPGLDCPVLPMPARKSRGISLLNLRQARGVLAASRPDLFLTYNWPAVEWALANRWRPVCPHLHFEDGFGPEEADGRQIRRRVLLRRLAFGARTRVLVPSTTLWRIATETWRLAPTRVLRVPNGIDVEVFARPPAADSIPGFHRRPGETVIGALGALRPEKRFDRLIRAFAALPAGTEARLVIAGEGDLKPELERVARELGLVGRALFPGRVTPERAVGHFDVLALASDTEQMPYCVLEAMAAGLPVVATDVGDVRRMVAWENRPCVVARGDEAALSARLGELIDDPPARQRVGAANQMKARREFGAERMFAAYEALFSGTA
jgi:L-malate glycosyltransferase